MNDQFFMGEAFKEAVLAEARGECPVGAVLVKDNRIIIRSGNREIEQFDPTAHAEMLCLREAGRVLGSHVLTGCTMYTTLWPCPMCQGAMLQAQINRAVSGARTFKWITEERFNGGLLTIDGPIREDDCRALMIEWAKKNNRLEILEKEGLL